MNIYTITGPDINNGIGFRVTIWVAGCPHKCKGCHNAWLQNYSLGKEYSDDIYNIIKEKVNHDYIDGITLSGGDPLGQNYSSLCQLNDFLTRFKQDFPNKTVWIYSGYTIEELQMLNDEKCRTKSFEILDKCDVMVDGRFIENLKDLSLPFRGSSNQRLINLSSFR